jgi:hypothetical protein
VKEEHVRPELPPPRRFLSAMWAVLGIAIFCAASEAASPVFSSHDFAIEIGANDGLTPKTNGGSASRVVFTGSLTFSSSSTLDIDLGGTPTPANAGVTYDQLVFSSVAATCTINGPVLKVNLLGTPTLNQPYRVIDTENGGSINIVNFFAGLTNGVEHDTGTNIKYIVEADSSRVDITLTQVPEPGGVLWLIAGTTAARRRRTLTGAYK